MRQLRFSVLSILLCLAAISALALTAFPLEMGAAAATTWYVATTGNDATGDGSAGNPWRTIAYAANNASVLNGDTIQVAAGTYTESVSTSKSLTFEGAQHGVDARDRSASETVWVVPSPSSPTALHATISTGTVTVDGFKFIGGPACVDLHRATVFFKNNIVEVPEGCTGPTGVFYLVRISDAGSATIQHNDISTTTPALLPNVACVEVKISLNPGTVLVDGNRLHNASGSGGFDFDQGINGGTMTFTNNEVYDNTGDGININGKFNTITATYNSFHDNTGNGVYVYDSGTQAGTVNIHNCDVYGNGQYGLYNATTSGKLTIDAAQNFWGDGTPEYPYNESGAAFGPNISGVTTDPLDHPACAPSVTTNAASNIATTSARLNGNLTSLGTASTVTVSFQWGTSSGSYPNATAGQNKTSTGTFYSDLSSLTPGTTYYYRAKAVGNGTSYGTEETFTTPTATTAPSVTTNAASNIATTSARLNGNLTSLGTASTVTVSFQWGTSSGSYPNATTGQNRASTGTFYFDLGSLTPSTTYYYRAKAVGDGTGYGSEETFATTTPTIPPSVTTNAASNIATTSARLNGNLTSLGTASSVTVSFVWGTSPGSYPYETTGQVLSTAGTFFFDLTSLTPGTNYCYQAKAVGDGISYGDENSFATTTIPPSVSTDAPSNIATTSATLNASLTSLGTATSVVVSFDWGTGPGSYPYETTPQVLYTTGTFSFDLDSLTPGTTYYYKAQAMGDGTGYGTEKSFTTTAATIPPSVTTNDASSIATTSARLNGNLTSLGTATSVTASFVWGTTSGSYPYETATRVLTTTQTFFSDLSSLTPGTTYYYKAKAVGDGTSYGAEKSFITTTTTPPSVSTNAATNIATTSARLNGNLTSLGTAGTVTVSFEWGTSSGSYPNATGGQSRSSTGSFYSDLGSLTPATTYYFRAKAVGNGTSYGTERSFTTTTETTPSLFGTGWYEQFTGYRPTPSLAYVYGNTQACQTFTPTKDHYFNSVSLLLYRTGFPTCIVTIALYDVDGSHRPVQPALCSTTLTASSLLNTATSWRTCTFTTGYGLSAGTEYAMVISANGGNAPNRINVRTYATDVYSGGQLGTSSNAGAIWQMNPDADVAFKEGQDCWHESQTSANPGILVSNQRQAYQTFTPSRDHYLNCVMLRLYKIGYPAFTATLALHNVDGNGQPTGSALCSTTFLASSLTSAATWRTYVFPDGYQVSAGTRYALVISGGSATYGNVVASTQTPGSYAAGECGLSTDGGTIWQALPGADLAFQEGESPWYASLGTSNNSVPVYGQNQLCQTFTPTKSHYFNYVSLSLFRIDNPMYDVTISLYNVDENHQPTGSALCSTSFAASSLTTPKPSWYVYPWYEFRFPTGYQLSQGTEYALVLSGNGGDATACVNARIFTSNRYPGGQRGESTDDGGSWQMLPTQDMAFMEGGSSTAAQLGSGWYDQFTGHVPSPSTTPVYAQRRVCQTFTPSKSYYFNSASLCLSKAGIQNYTVTIALYATNGNHHPVEPALCSTTFANSSIPLSTPTWRTYAFTTGHQLSAGTEYALVISTNGGDASNRVIVRTYDANSYSSGQLGTSSDAGGTWQMDPNVDMAFKSGQSNWRESQISTSPAVPASGQTQVYQTFTASRDHYFNYVALYLYKIGLPTYKVTIALHNVDGNNQPVQPALCSTSFAASTLSWTASWRTYLFSTGYSLSAGNRYAIVLSCGGSVGSVMVGANSAGGYSSGEFGRSTDGGATWLAFPGPDLAFREGDNPWFAAFGASNSSAYVYGQNQLCQTFTPGKSHYFEYVSFSLFRIGNPMYNVTISLYNVDVNHQPTGSALCSTSFAASALTLPRPSWYTFPWYEFRFPTGSAIYSGTEYALVLSADGGDAANCVTVRIYTKNYYAGGQRGESTNAGASWQMLPTQDMTFTEGGVALA